MLLFADFGDDSSKVHVAVGDAVTYDCVVRSVSDTKIQCVLSRFAVGKHSLSVHVSRKGKLRGKNQAFDEK